MQSQIFRLPLSRVNEATMITKFLTFYKVGNYKDTYHNIYFFAQYSAFKMFAIIVYYMIMFWFLHEKMQTCKPT